MENKKDESTVGFVPTIGGSVLTALGYQDKSRICGELAQLSFLVHDSTAIHTSVNPNMICTHVCTYIQVTGAMSKKEQLLLYTKTQIPFMKVSFTPSRPKSLAHTTQ